MLVKLSNIKFNEIPFTDYPVCTYEQTVVSKLMRTYMYFLIFGFLSLKIHFLPVRKHKVSLAR
jgi:hypothetical protein